MWTGLPLEQTCMCTSMCAFLVVALSTVFLGVAGSCPDYWTAFQESCYVLVENPSTWAGAAEICREFHSSLVSVESNEENKFLHSFIKSKNVKTDRMWIGGNDLLSKDTWMWEDGSTFTFTDWGAGEPNRNGPDASENCVDIVLTRDLYTWNDESCFNRAYFICEQTLPTNPVIG